MTWSSAGWARPVSRRTGTSSAVGCPEEIDLAAMRVADSTTDTWLLVPTHSPVEVAETLLRHGVELLPQQTFTGDGGWERVADVVMARHNAP